MTQSYQPAPFSAVPEAFGLYDPRFEHDACGVSFICQIKGVASRSIVTDALDALCNLDHRGASGAEVNTGDGAGVLIQMPHKFFVEVCKPLRFSLPAACEYGCGLIYLPRNASVKLLKNVLRVSKLSSFFRIAPSRSSDTEPTSFTIRGSRSPATSCALTVRATIDITDTSRTTASARNLIPPSSGFSRTVDVAIISP